MWAIVAIGLWLFCLQTFDGVEHLMIPIDGATLCEFVDQHKDI